MVHLPQQQQRLAGQPLLDRCRPQVGVVPEPSREASVDVLHGDSGAWKRLRSGLPVHPALPPVRITMNLGDPVVQPAAATHLVTLQGGVQLGGADKVRQRFAEAGDPARRCGPRRLRVGLSVDVLEEVPEDLRPAARAGGAEDGVLPQQLDQARSQPAPPGAAARRGPSQRRCRGWSEALPLFKGPQLGNAEAELRGQRWGPPEG